MGSIIIILVILFLSILLHEIGHLIVALLVKVKVEKLAIGFLKPILRFKIKDVKITISPLLLGGYLKLKGENEKIENGFLSLPYSKKFALVMGGILVNLLIILFIYLINYRSIYLGFCGDFYYLTSLLTNNFNSLYSFVYSYTPNIYLLQASSFNLACVLFNLLPVPPLDGGLIWLLSLEKFFNLNIYLKIYNLICKIGTVSLVVIQILLIYWVL